GKEWKIDFLYDPLTDNKPFRMRFKDCTVGHWEFYGEAGDEHEEIADVIGFDFCSNEAGKFVVLHTDCFEVIIHYGTLEVAKDWYFNDKGSYTPLMNAQPQTGRRPRELSERQINELLRRRNAQDQRDPFATDPD